jgi:hypothetical protein
MRTQILHATRRGYGASKSTEPKGTAEMEDVIQEPEPPSSSNFRRAMNREFRTALLA